MTVKLPPEKNFACGGKREDPCRKRSKIKEIILCKDNKKDIDQINENI